MKIFKMVEVKNRAYCRYDTGCDHWVHGSPIPKGSKILRISVDSAGGPAVALFCPKHTKAVLRDMKKFLEPEQN